MPYGPYSPTGPDGYSQPDGLPPDYYGSGEVYYDPRTMAGYDSDRLLNDQQNADALWRRMENDQQAAAARGVTSPAAPIQPPRPPRYTPFADRLHEHIRQRGGFTLINMHDMNLAERTSGPVRDTLTGKEQAARQTTADAYRALFDNPDTSTIAQGIPLNLYMYPQDVDFCNDFLDFMEQVEPIVPPHQRRSSQLHISLQPSRSFLRDPRRNILFHPHVQHTTDDGKTADVAVNTTANYRRFIDSIPTGELDDTGYLYNKIGAYSLASLYDRSTALQDIVAGHQKGAQLWLCTDRVIRATINSNSYVCLPPPAIEGDAWPTISLAPTTDPFALSGVIATRPEQKLIEAAYETIR